MVALRTTPTFKILLSRATDDAAPRALADAIAARTYCSHHSLGLATQFAGHSIERRVRLDRGRRSARWCARTFERWRARGTAARGAFRHRSAHRR